MVFSSCIEEKESVMKLSRVGVDLAKNVYQLHGLIVMERSSGSGD